MFAVIIRWAKQEGETTPPPPHPGHIDLALPGLCWTANDTGLCPLKCEQLLVNQPDEKRGSSFARSDHWPRRVGVYFTE